jgi:hypothetical protein
MRRKHEDPSTWKGLLAGIAGGLAGTWVMTQFQNTFNAIWNRESSGEQTDGRPKEQEPATVKAAQALSKRVLGRTLSESEKDRAGMAMHYAFGTVSGGLYGVIVEAFPSSAAGSGVLFGILLWAVGDEVAVPALGLSGPPSEYPLSIHAYALASHVVYGFTTETVRRTVRSSL